MDDETRAAFARIDRWFELSQAQHQEVRHDLQEMRHDLQEMRHDLQEMRHDLQEMRHDLQEMRHDMQDMRQQISRLDAGLTALRGEFRTFRDWATLQFAELRAAIEQLTLRVERLEHRQNDPIG